MPMLSIDDGCCDISIRMKNYWHCAVANDVLIDIYDNKRKVKKKRKKEEIAAPFRRQRQHDEESERDTYATIHNLVRIYKVRSSDVSRKHLRFTIFDAVNSCAKINCLETVHEYVCHRTRHRVKLRIYASPVRIIFFFSSFQSALVE